MEQSPIYINFKNGLDTKDDPNQLPIGRFVALKNSVFTTGNRLTKRPGYGEIITAPTDTKNLTTLNDNLTAIGPQINSYSSSLNSWVNKGTLQPCSLEVIPLIRNSLNQVQADSVTSSGLTLTAYTQVHSTVTGLVTQYEYAIADSTTGQLIVQPTTIPILTAGVIQGSPRTYVIGNFFVVVSPVTVAGTTYLQYFSISIMSPTSPSLSQNVTSQPYVPTTSVPGWDGVTINNSSNNVLIVAFNTTSGGQGIHVATLTAQQVASNQASAIIRSFTNAAYIASIVGICVDTTASPNLIYFTFFNASSSVTYTGAVFIGLGTITQQFAPVSTLTALTVANLTCAAQNNSCTIFAEIVNAYSYASTAPTNYIEANTVSSAGTAGTAYIALRSVGIASKAFIVNEVMYLLSTYKSQYQSTYFLINGTTTLASSPVIVAKLAYQNGAGYYAYGLPGITVDDTIASLSYLITDLVQPITVQNVTQQTVTGGIYSQTGVNIINFTLGTPLIDTAELSGSLQISGGFLGQYDGSQVVEQNFFLFPDSVTATWTANSVVTPTGTFSSGSNQVVVSSASGISVGMSITDTSNAYIPAGSTILYISGTTLTISANTTHSAAGDSLSIQGNIAAIPSGGVISAVNYYYSNVYTWTDMQGLTHRSAPSIPVPVTTSGSASTGIITVNTPTLRLTSKISNPLIIENYRWSVATQEYTLVNTAAMPVINSTTIDSVSFVDTSPDSQVVGNLPLYTTGGVVPNTNGPASDVMCLFDTRLWQLDSENPNVLWVAKQSISGTPVEMSTRFKINIPPTTGSEQSLGNARCIFPMDDKLVIFFQSGIQYINGVGPDSTGATSIGCALGNYSQPVFVTSSVGCTNQASIVLTAKGLMFQSEKGIWLLGRDLSTSYIGDAVESSNAEVVTSAVSIPQSTYVLFTLDTSTMLMYDYYYNQWGTFNGVHAVSSCLYRGVHAVLDTYGRVGQQTADLYLDFGNPVLLSFITGWLNLAGIIGYQRLYEFLLQANYLSPHFIQVGIAYDYNPSPLQGGLISPNNSSGSVPTVATNNFGDPVPVGGAQSQYPWRVHAKKQLSRSFQISISEVYDGTQSNGSTVVPSGAGFTLSSIMCWVGIKRGKAPIRASNAIGLR